MINARYVTVNKLLRVFSLVIIGACKLLDYDYGYVLGSFEVFVSR